MNVKFIPFDQHFVNALRDGGVDAYGSCAETDISNGHGNPCRSCLRDIPEGAKMLVCAGRPFNEKQPYAETGPIFFCEEPCEAFDDDRLPEILTTSPDYLLKGYGHNDRIQYGTGKIVKSEEIIFYAESLLSRDDVAYVDVRSARNNCFQTRIISAHGNGTRSSFEST